MEIVMPLKAKISSLRVLMETKLEEADWVKMRYKKLSLISEKRLAAIYQ
jgi:hypothetical protein